METNEPVGSKIARLATQLANQKAAMRGRPPFVLVLGSNVMPVSAIEDQILESGLGISETDRQGLRPIDRANHLKEVWQRLRHDSDDALRGCIQGVFESEATEDPDDGYSNLAELIREGYFDLIITTDISRRLENALIRLGFAMTKWDVHSHDGKSSEQLQRLLQLSNPKTKILKLYGDIYKDFTFNRRDIPNYLGPIIETLQGYLARPMLLVAHDAERDLWSFPTAQSSLYYVSNRDPQPESAIFTVLEQRAVNQHIVVIPESTFDTLFSELRNILIGRGQQPGLQDLQDSGIPIEEEKYVEAYSRRIEMGRTDSSGYIDTPTQPFQTTASKSFVQSLVDVLDPTVLRIQYDNDQRVVFGMYSAAARVHYASERAELMRYDVDDANDIMMTIGRNIAAFHASGNKEGHDAWRQLAKDMGRKLFHTLFEENPDLMRKFGVAQQASGTAENLSLCLAGPRNHLGMPYELLCDTEPFAIRHPLYRQIIGVEGNYRTFAEVLSELRRTEMPLRVLLIASETNGIDADHEVQELNKLMLNKTAALKIAAEIEVLPTIEASRNEVEQLIVNRRYHIIHFAGHSKFDLQQSDESGLYFFEKKNRGGKLVLLTARALAQLLRKSATQLVFFNSCVGAMVGGKSLLKHDYLGLIDAAVMAGVPNLLGYRWEVTDRGAIAFSTRFYEQLLVTQCPARAALRARCDVYTRNDKDETWTSPILVIQKS